MNDYNISEGNNCYFHPNEVVVGVCALCLRERLIILASNSKQGNARDVMSNKPFRYLRKTTISSLKVFAISTLLHLLESRHSSSNYKDCVDFYSTDGDEDEDSTDTFEDSFISIKFESNGNAEWDYKKTANKTDFSPKTANTCSIKEHKEIKSIVEYTKRSRMLRWHKRIGQFLQLAQWKKSNKANACHAGLGNHVEGFKGRKNWLRSLTKRTTSID